MQAGYSKYIAGHHSTGVSFLLLFGNGINDIIAGVSGVSHLEKGVFGRCYRFLWWRFCLFILGALYAWVSSPSCVLREEDGSSGEEVATSILAVQDLKSYFWCVHMT